MDYNVKKLSQKDITLISDESYVHIIIPNGDGTYSSKRIRAGLIGTELKREQNKNSNFTIDLPANSKLDDIDLRFVSDAPVIKIGTTDGGEEIMSERTLSSGDLSLISRKTFLNAQTIYFSISGGTIHVNLNYKPNYF